LLGKWESRNASASAQNAMTLARSSDLLRRWKKRNAEARGEGLGMEDSGT